MSFRFRKKIKIAPGVAINLNKSTFGLGKGDGASVTLGVPGLGVNINKKGTEGFAGVNGTGLGYRTSRSDSTNKSTTIEIPDIDELQEMEFDKRFSTKRSATLAFIKSFLAAFCCVLAISLLVSIFVAYQFNELLVASIWLLVPLFWGWKYSSNVNDEVKQCECGSFEFSIKQIEHLNEDHLYTNKNGSPDKRKKHNPVVTTSLVGAECAHCNKVTNQEEVIHL